jgi:hypothetical protein
MAHCIEDEDQPSRLESKAKIMDSNVLEGHINARGDGVFRTFGMKYCEVIYST